VFPAKSMSKFMLAGALAGLLSGGLWLTPRLQAQSVALLDSGRSSNGSADQPGVLPIVRPAERVTPTCGSPGTRGSLSSYFIGVGVPPEGDMPMDVAFTPDGAKIVVAHRDSQNLIVFDAGTRVVLQTIPVSGSPNSLAITADGQYAVTANLFENTASIVDLSIGAEVAAVPVGTQPGVVRVTPDSTTAVVGNTIDSDLSVIDLATRTELRRIPAAIFFEILSWNIWAYSYRFTDFRIGADNNTIVFPDLLGSQILFGDIAAGTMTAVPSETNPALMDMSADGTTAVVSHYLVNKLTVVDVLAHTITKVVPTVGNMAMPPVAINGAKTKAVYLCLNAVRIVNLVTGAISPELFTGAVFDMRTTADGHYCMIGNYLSTLVSYDTESIVANILTTGAADTLAVSPAGPRAVLLHGLGAEFIDVLNTNGGSAYFEQTVPSGPPPEGDKARGVAFTPDASKAVVINNHSLNATLMDLTTRSITAVVPVGNRPATVAITPDGTQAVVANLDSYFTTVIDLATANVTNVPMGRRAGRVAISPNSQYAYLPVIADGDGVTRIDLHTLSVAGPKVLTGNMGTIGYTFDAVSGIALSHNGATLVTCGSFDNNISVINTSTWAEVARVAVGAFPVRAVFSPDDSTIYVSNGDADSVSVVANAGSGSHVTGTVFVGDQPWELDVNPTNTRLYVANYLGKSISVVALPANVVEATIPLPQTNGGGEPLGLHVSADGTALSVTANGADFHVIDTATNSIQETLNTGLVAADFKFHDPTHSAFMACPFGADGLTVVQVTLPGDLNCDGSVGFGDINPFVQILSDFAGWQAAHPGCPWQNGDINADGSVSFADINPFVALLTGS
jgi:YVTN family beta-propeller protein